MKKIYYSILKNDGDLNVMTSILKNQFFLKLIITICPSSDRTTFIPKFFSQISCFWVVMM